MYTEVILGNSPILLTVPHDGSVLFPDAVTRSEQLYRDENTETLARRCNEELGLSEIHPSILVFHLHRHHVDVNRSLKREPYAPGFEEHYTRFHQALDEAIELSLTKWGRCFHLDLHAFVNSPGPEEYDFVIGSNRHKTCPRETDLRLMVGLSELQHESLGRKYRVVFSPDKTKGVDGRYSGGWVSWRTAKEYGHKGLESLQLECNAATCLDRQVVHKTAQHLSQALIKLL
jgi:hypothetical protein